MDYEYEPMEVDLSSNSNNAMDISYKDLDKIPVVKIKEEPYAKVIHSEENTIGQETKLPAIATPSVMKRFSVNIPPRRENVLFVTNTTMSITLILVGLISILTYQIMHFECSKPLDINEVRQSLSSNLYGQPQAIQNIIEGLEAKSNSKLFLFYGGTGVGKTLTISLILEALYHYANIYHYTMPSFVEKISTDVMLGLNLCPSSVIVVDDLNRNDMIIEKYVRKFIEKSENLGKNITIILSFNCDFINDQYIKKCDYSFYSDLVKAFDHVKALKIFVKFNMLNEEHLRKCIEKELGSKRLSEEQFNKITKNFNVTIDGCKGVYKKIKLLNVIKGETEKFY